MDAPRLIVIMLTTAGMVVLIGLLVIELLKTRPAMIPRFARLSDGLRRGQMILQNGLQTSRVQFAQAAHVHPSRLNAIFETAFWGIILLSLIDDLRSSNSLTAFIVWALIIAWHEMGHLICSPFGTFIMFAGGSIWQVLIWVIMAAVLLGRRRLSGALLALAVGGHSLINLARYIDDARARKLPLLFGMDSTHHDWWYLLSHTGLLDWDHVFAAITAGLGVIVVVGVSLGGVWVAWFLPRTRLRRGG